MKTSTILRAFAAVLCAGLALASTAFAAAKQDAAKATPKGGRLLEKTEPRAEFVVEKDHTVTIHFYDATMKPVPATTQAVTAVADGKGGKVTVEFEKKGDSLASKAKLPEGDGYNLVVQFRQTTDARPQNFRFKLDLTVCGECKRAEYGCICDD